MPKVLLLLLVSMGELSFSASTTSPPPRTCGVCDSAPIRCPEPPATPPHCPNESLPTNGYTMDECCRVSLQSLAATHLSAATKYSAAMAFFRRNCIARDAVANIFEDLSADHDEAADDIINYMGLRGAPVTNLEIDSPTRYTFPDVQAGLQFALDLELQINQLQTELYVLALETCRDPDLQNFLSVELISWSIQMIDKISRFMARLSSMNCGLGEFLLDGDIRRVDPLDFSPNIQ